MVVIGMLILSEVGYFVSVLHKFLDSGFANSVPFDIQFPYLGGTFLGESFRF